MKLKAKEYKDIDDYISQLEPGIQKRMQEVRKAISQAAPKATEAISYQIPTFKQNGNLVHFAAFKNHIGFYPTPAALDEFAEELSIYKRSKGTAQFPHDKPLPISLIKKMVKKRVADTTAAQKQK